MIDHKKWEESDLEYYKMKDFFSFYVERYLNVDGLTAEKQPMAILESFEKKSMKMAFKGLRQSINDCIELSLHFDNVEVEKLDSQLRDNGIITLSELRRRHSKKYAKILKRGKINNEVEYYLARNVLEAPVEKAPGERELLEKMVSDYEGV